MRGISLYRNEKNQLDHDKCVKKIATFWRDDGGYIVYADIEGWDKPGNVFETEGYIPDILARKHGTARICEVETEDTLESHRKQWEAFKRYAEKTSGTSFVLYLAKEGGKGQHIK